MLSFDWEALEEILNENKVGFCTVVRESWGFFGCQVARYCGVSSLVRTGEAICHVLYVAGIVVAAPSLSISMACGAAQPALRVPLEMACLNCCSSRQDAALCSRTWQLGRFVLELNVNTPVGARKHLDWAGRGAAVLCEIALLLLTSHLAGLHGHSPTPALPTL